MPKGKDKSKTKKDADKDPPPSADATPHPSPGGRKSKRSKPEAKKKGGTSSDDETPEIVLHVDKKGKKTDSSSDKDGGDGSKGEGAAPCTKEDFQNLGNVLAKAFRAIKAQQEASLAQGEKIIAALQRGSTPPSASKGGSAAAPPAPAPAPVLPMGKFTFTTSELNSIACLASQLYYSIGGWSARWEVDKAVTVNQATGLALAHIRKSCIMEILEPEVQVSHPCLLMTIGDHCMPLMLHYDHCTEQKALRTRIKNKINNDFQVSASMTIHDTVLILIVIDCY